MKLLRYSCVSLAVVLGFIAIVASTTPGYVSRFTDNLDGTIKDNNSGLIWLKDAGALDTAACVCCDDEFDGYEVLDDFNAGIGYPAEDYVAGTYTDWRLPEIEELDEVSHGAWPVRCRSVTTRRCDTRGFKNVSSEGYWSGTTQHERNCSRAYIFMNTGATFFFGGLPPVGGPPTYAEMQLWPVRSANIR